MNDCKVWNTEELDRNDTSAQLEMLCLHNIIRWKHCSMLNTHSNDVYCTSCKQRNCFRSWKGGLVSRLSCFQLLITCSFCILQVIKIGARNDARVKIVKLVKGGLLVNQNFYSWGTYICTVWHQLRLTSNASSGLCILMLRNNENLVGYLASRT